LVLAEETGGSGIVEGGNAWESIACTVNNCNFRIGEKVMNLPVLIRDKCGKGEDRRGDAW